MSIIQRTCGRTYGQILMDKAVAETVATCFSIVLTDEPWQDFGFPKRPRSGRWFQRFRPRWRVDLEKRVLQQMLSSLTAAYIVAEKIPQEAIDILVDAYTSNIDLAVALGFSSQSEGASFLKDAIDKYTSSLPRQWPEILCSCIQPDRVPDKKLAARLLVGCIQFGTSASNMILVLRSKTP